MLTDAVMGFYFLELYEPNKVLWRELIDITVTQLLIQRDLYALIINLITLSHQNQVKALDYLMRKKQIKLADVKLNKKYHLNVLDREV